MDLNVDAYGANFVVTEPRNRAAQELRLERVAAGVAAGFCNLGIFGFQMLLTLQAVSGHPPMGSLSDFSTSVLKIL